MEVTGLEPVTPCLQITHQTLILLPFNNLHYAQNGIGRKKAATGATYTQPEFKERVFQSEHSTHHKLNYPETPIHAH